MEFIEFKKELQNYVANIIKNKKYLFVTDTDNDILWNLYLDSFPKGSNEIYRERREFDCNCCKNFIRNFGNVVVIENNELISIWDLKLRESIYTPVIKELSKYVKSKSIINVFVSDINKFGTNKSYERKEDKVVREWDHFYIEIPIAFINCNKDDKNSKMGEFRDIKNVFKRSLDEINISYIKTILELIAQNSLYRGAEWKTVLEKFLQFKEKYETLQENIKDIFCWDQSSVAGPVIGKIRNHSIGVLLTDISNNMDLDVAVSRYEKIVAPTNYKRPKPIFTAKMIEEAKEKLTELGFIESLKRRYAKLDDISINNVLFANRDSALKLSGDVFSELQKETSSVEKKFNSVEEVHIEKFIKDILPKISNMEIFVENKHTKNLVSLIAPVNKDSKIMFKWNNNFSWAYKGNITDSMKENVKKAGGNVEGVLRFSIQWNENNDNKNDFDAHCIEPDGNRIYFGHKKSYKSLGQLDVDIIHPTTISVENITWQNKDKMLEGQYEFLVHNFTHRGGKSGFKAEIEYDNQIYSYEYNKELKQSEFVSVAKISFDKKSGIKFIKSLPSTYSKKSIWNITTMEFIPVYVLMLSPNYWDNQNGIGNKHYLFMLKNCINDESPNGFFNEFLINDLSPHRKVLESLGSKMSVEGSENQLSGLGFSDTLHESIICKVSGNFTRIIKIVF